MRTFYTIGHSNRDVGTVMEMLKDAGIGLLADVRAFPRSRANPAFNLDCFPSLLEHHRIQYRHFDALGGRRPKQAGIDEEVNALWRVRSFHNYADYALGESFRSALRELESASAGASVALMCSEAVWWRCHRRIIADHLLAHGHRVDHLMAPGRTQDAVFTAGAVTHADASVTYPAPKS